MLVQYTILVYSLKNETKCLDMSFQVERRINYGEFQFQHKDDRPNFSKLKACTVRLVNDFGIQVFLDH